MWKKFVKDYLSFSKKDRIGVLVLLTLILLVFLLPYCWPKPPAKQLPKAEADKIQQLASRLQQKDVAQQENYVVEHSYSSPANHYNNAVANTALFYFDPNTLSANGWQKLGLRDKTIATIQHYIAKGGKFKKPEDVGKVYGLSPMLYERLLPFVRIAGNAFPSNENNEPNKPFEATPKVYPGKLAIALKTIEINSADTLAFIALPGIGSKLAARIVNFRDKLGGFYAVDQLAETYGLPDSTFSKIKNVLQCNVTALKTININTADVNALKQHPYIRWNLANAIVQYRQQHGNFKSVDDLQQITIITAEIFQKLKPYVSVD